MNTHMKMNSTKTRKTRKANRFAGFAVAIMLIAVFATYMMPPILNNGTANKTLETKNDNATPVDMEWVVDAAYIDDMAQKTKFSEELADVKATDSPQPSDEMKEKYLSAIAKKRGDKVVLNPMMLYASINKWKPSILEKFQVKSHKDFYTSDYKVSKKGQQCFAAFRDFINADNIGVVTCYAASNATNTGFSHEQTVFADRRAGIFGDRDAIAVVEVNKKDGNRIKIADFNPVKTVCADSPQVYENTQLTRCGNATYPKVDKDTPRGDTDNPKPDPKPEPKDPKKNPGLAEGNEDKAGDGKVHNDQKASQTEPQAGDDGVIDPGKTQEKQEKKSDDKKIDAPKANDPADAPVLVDPDNAGKANSETISPEDADRAADAIEQTSIKHMSVTGTIKPTLIDRIKSWLGMSKLNHKIEDTSIFLINV